MEKKGNRSVQGSPKGLTNDVSNKKNQDASNGGKQWPRGSRRREPTGLNNLSTTKPETNRKPTPQRNKTIVDKRPKPRGSGGGGCNNNSSSTSGKTNAELTESPPHEVGSVFNPGSKKLNNNNCIMPIDLRYSRSHGERGGHRFLGATQHYRHKYNKEHFLQANCQFVVNACGDYKQYMNNPDALVNWDLIEQVNVQVSEYPSCPICLYPPVAAKMTRCGHIYCWSCILHYLTLSDKTWHKCPICYEAIYKQDLKSVVSFLHPPLNVNDTITFKLMKRQRGSLTAYPIDHNIPPEEYILYDMSQIETNGIYSKLVIADRSQVIAIIERESSELREHLSLEDDDCSEKCFIEQAITLLKDRESFVLKSGVNEEKKNVASSLEEVEDVVGVVEDVNSSQQGVKYFYFYQAFDGQHIYLHPLNIEMLVYMYGSLENCPRTITGKIVEKDGDSMTEEIRKKNRYLQHLPVTCQYEMAEINLKPPLVSRETLDHFKDKLEMRRKKRQLKARDEKRREKRIAEEENKKFLGKYPTPNIHIESHQHFPEFQPEAASSFKRSESESSILSPPSSSSQFHVGSVNESGLSFAKMLSSSRPHSTANAWPQLKTVKQEPVKIINVTGAKASTSFTVKARSQSECDDIEQDDVDCPVPTPKQTFADVFSMAFASNGEDGNGKKKKKKKPKAGNSMNYSRD